MKAQVSWSMPRYVPADKGGDTVYINQIIPKKDALYIAFSPKREGSVLYYRHKDTSDEWLRAECYADHVEISELECDSEYEFYLKNGDEYSSLGYARTGDVFGTVVNYLHPEDNKYAFSGQYLCTPCLLVHPDGYLLASMDLYGKNTPQNLTLIFRSDDGGKSWYHICELFPCFWGKLFLHKGDVYMLSVSTEHGDLLIGRSTDGGASFGTPTVIARGSCRTDVAGWHKSAMPIVEHNGRLWTGIDYGAHKTGGYASALLSAPSDSDLMSADSWSITDPLKYDPTWTGAVCGDNRGFLEGNAVVSPDGRMLNFLRYSTDKGDPSYGLAAVLCADESRPEDSLTFDRFVSFPGNLSKFDILFDRSSGYYFSLVSRVYDASKVKARNLLSLAASRDLENWVALSDVIDGREYDWSYVGFQYVSFDFDGDDIIFLSRTAFNGAKSYHDNNYVTFHRIKNYRSLIDNK